MVWQVWFTTRGAALRLRSPVTLSARNDPHSAVPRAMRQRLEKDFIGVVASFRLQARH
jgi:hypothetical protein